LNFFTKKKEEKFHSLIQSLNAFDALMTTFTIAKLAIINANVKVNNGIHAMDFDH